MIKPVKCIQKWGGSFSLVYTLSIYAKRLERETKVKAASETCVDTDTEAAAAADTDTDTNNMCIFLYILGRLRICV